MCSMHKIERGNDVNKYKYKYVTCVLVSGLLLEILCFLYIPILDYIERVSLAEGRDEISHIISVGLTFIIILVATQYMAMKIKAMVARKIANSATVEFANYLLIKNPEELLTYGKSDYLLALNKVNSIFGLMQSQLSVVVSVLMLAIVVIYIIVIMDIWYLICIVALLVLMLTSGAISQPIENKRKKLNDVERQGLLLIDNVVKSIDTIKNFYMEGSIKKIYCDNSNRIKKYQLQEKKYDLILYTYMQIVRCFIMILIPSVTAYLGSLGRISSESIVVSSYIFFYIMGHVMKVIGENGEIRKFKADLVFLRKYERIKEKKMGAMLDLNGTLRFQSFSVSYGNTRIVTDLSFDVSINRITIIKGMSGNGKSTLLKSIVGLKDIDEGKIYDENGEIQIVDLLTQICYSPQDPILFNVPFWKAVSLSNSTIERKDIDKYIMKICPSLFNKLTNCDNVCKLSGGQKKLVDILRTIATDRKIIVMDEPTSGMDSDTIERFVGVITELAKTKYIIIATHEEKLLKNGFEIISM